jgi:hypothetical protein
MAAVPRAANASDAWAEGYGNELKGIVTRYANLAPRSVQKHLGPSELGHECLAGETEVVTRSGLQKIEDVFRGTGPQELLVPMLYSGSEVRKRWGKFQQAPVTRYGERDLLKVTLRRNQEVKVVHATPDHHWFRMYWSGKQKKQQRLATTELKPGHKLAQLRRAMPRSAALMPVAVAQGFVFGDGTKGSSDGKHRAAVLSLYHNGKDEAMLRFFPGEHKQYKDPGHEHAHTYVRNLPRSWKRLPPIDESCAFLVSWLAGYFAADGCVTEDGHCSISSADRTHLEFVRSLAAVCGIGYGLVQEHWRRGISGKEIQAKPTALYRLSLRRRDLPDWFFLISAHRTRAAAANEAQERDPHWIVESVEHTGRREQVYCATVPGIGAFALADDLMTGNCDRQVVAKMAGAKATNHVADPWASVMGTAGHAYVADAFDWDNRHNGYLRWLTEARVTPDPGPDPHPGTTDLYDLFEQAVVDHKFQGDSTRARLKSKGPPRHYYVQILLYGLGVLNLGLPVRRVAIVSWPRTKSTLDDMYVWSHVPTPDDWQLVNDVLVQTRFRQQVADAVRAGTMDLMDVPAVPEDNECYFCLLYRPQAFYDGQYGCPGTLQEKGKT